MIQCVPQYLASSETSSSVLSGPDKRLELISGWKRLGRKTGLENWAVVANTNRRARNNGLAPLGKKANKPLLAVYASGNSWLSELDRGFVFKSSATIRLRIYRKRVPCSRNSLFSMSSVSKIWNPASFSMRSLVWLVVLNISSIEPNQNPN